MVTDNPTDSRLAYLEFVRQLLLCHLAREVQAAYLVGILALKMAVVAHLGIWPHPMILPPISLRSVLMKGTSSAHKSGLANISRLE